jgi:hypothetical protein
MKMENGKMNKSTGADFSLKSQSGDKGISAKSAPVENVSSGTWYYKKLTVERILVDRELSAPDYSPLVMYNPTFICCIFTHQDRSIHHQRATGWLLLRRNLPAGLPDRGQEKDPHSFSTDRLLGNDLHEAASWPKEKSSFILSLQSTKSAFHQYSKSSNLAFHVKKDMTNSKQSVDFRTVHLRGWQLEASAGRIWSFQAENKWKFPSQTFIRRVQASRRRRWSPCG